MSDDRTPSQGDDSHDNDLHVRAEQDRTGTTIILEGDFDLSGIERFSAAYREALAASPRSIILNAHGLTFIDSSGLRPYCRPVLLPLTRVWRSVSVSRRPHFGG